MQHRSDENDGEVMMHTRNGAVSIDSLNAANSEAARLKQTYIRLYTEAKLENNLRMMHFYAAILETFEKRGKASHVKWTR
jgi:hypothetical protein